jgi:tRNA A37 threonylcarbamoyladenosine dehydratase
MHPFHRTELLVGGDGFSRLQGARVCVVGLGGVGSYAAEAIARSGVGHLTLVDFDRVCVTNINRQLPATRDTLGQLKATLMGERLASINPKAQLRVMPTFYDSHTSEEILRGGFDIVLDCIDNMTAKVHLIRSCLERNIPIISAMGAGGRMDPTRVRVSDLSNTKNDPFARIVRDLLRQQGIHDGVRCVWTDEAPNQLDEAIQEGFHCICPNVDDRVKHSCENRHQIQGTVSWMPAIFGLTMAGAAVTGILEHPIQENMEQIKLRQLPSQLKPSGDRKRQLLREAGFGAGLRQETP